ncbi:LamG-like jellyroll fold domain-containing protein [Flavobacterium sp.]|uniref:LamG-like jellyroll fold domain-containing protein n=1 Tax=Flavobacterium sp. TaxID=239 RepID=UPI0037BE618B
MKNKLLLIVFGLVMTTQMIFAQVPSYVPTNGLVGYWPFNGNANDQSGNGNNGTVNGATLTADRNGNSNSAYSFSSGSSVSVPMNYLLHNLPVRTFSCWFNANGSQNGGRIYETTYLNGGVAMYNGNILDAWYYNGPNECNVTNISTGNLNQWHNLVYVTDSNTGLGSIYLDGVFIASRNGLPLSSPSPSNWLNNFLKFGLGAQGESFVGKLDDIGIWNRALTQQEITAMYNGVTYSDTCNAVSGSLVNGLVAYYPFCGNAKDQSGNGNNGIVNGATLTTDRFGNSNSAYSFNNNNITIPHSSSFNFNDFTISLWISTSQSTTGVALKQVNFSDASNERFGMTVNSPVLSTEFAVKYNNPNCTGGIGWQNNISSESIYNNQFHHLVGTCSGNTTKLYIDGILVNTIVLPYSQSSICFGGDIQIGRDWSSWLHYFIGKIDDIGIWNRALTQQEITQLYNQNQCITNITVTDTLIINVGQMSYTNPVAYANNITIYPNPASTQININFNNITDLTGGTIKIINSLGQQVASTPITLTGTSTSMTLGSWGGNGIYFVQIINAQGQIVDIKKIILQ